jgi:hypothetical protein
MVLSRKWQMKKDNDLTEPAYKLNVSNLNPTTNLFKLDDVKAKRQFRRNKKHFVNMNPSIELENDQDMFGKDFMMRNENVSSIYRVHERERRVINEKERHQN